MVPASHVHKRPCLAEAATFARSALTGIVATLVHLGALSAGCRLLHLSGHIAIYPALILGGAVQFFGSRYFAFRATQASAGKQLGLFIVAEALTFGMNAGAFHLLVWLVPPDVLAVELTGLASAFVVYSVWSYPVWRWIFKAPGGAAARAPRNPL